jgi:hypothetical protein
MPNWSVIISDKSSLGDDSGDLGDDMGDDNRDPGDDMGDDNPGQ